MWHSQASNPASIRPLSESQHTFALPHYQRPFRCLGSTPPAGRIDYRHRSTGGPSEGQLLESSKFPAPPNSTSAEGERRQREESRRVENVRATPAKCLAGPEGDCRARSDSAHAPQEEL